MKSFHIKPGMVISLAIGLIFSLRLFLPLKRIFPRAKAVRLADTASLADILLSIAGIAVFAFCCWLIHQYLVQNRFPGQALNKRWVKGLTGVLLCLLLSHIFELTQWFYTRQLLLNPEPLRKFFFLNLRGLIIGGFQFFMVYYIATLKENQQAKIEIEQLKQENLLVRLNLLKQQISPHFLFNSLSTLKTIAPDEHTRQYIMQLSNVYRYLLNYNDNNMASLKDELAFTNSYLYILKERFEDALQIDIQVPHELLQKQLPPLALQILIENAIKHNIISTDDPLYITIRTEANEVLTVENNLQTRLSIEKNTGKGLQNINDRYHLLSGRQIDIINNGKQFIVKLPLLSA